MRILQVVIGYHPARGEFGGIVETVEHLSGELLRRGHEVEVWTSALVGRGRHLAHREVCGERGGLRIRYFPAFHPAPLGYGFAFSPAFARAVTREVRRFDVVHVNGYRNHLAVSAMMAADAAGVPYVVQTHGTIPPVVHRVLLKRAFDRVVGRALLARAGAIVAISHAEARLFAEHGVPPEAVDVVYNGIDLGMVARDLGAGDWFATALGIRAPRVLLYLGRLHERKGVQHLVAAFDALSASRDDVHLVIAGSDDGYEPTLRRQVARGARRDRITFAGPIYGDAKYRAYRSAALLVYPAVHEYFGLVPFEALLCGTPAVVVDGEGCAEVLADVDGGWTVPWADAASLARVIEGALAEQDQRPHERTRRVQAARERILARYTWPVAAERLLAVYERARGRAGRREG